MSFTFDFKKLLENALRFVTDVVSRGPTQDFGSVTRIAFKYKLTYRLTGLRVALGFASISSYASFVLSNLPRASITRWLHATRLPFLNRISRFLAAFTSVLFLPFLFCQVVFRVNTRSRLFI